MNSASSCSKLALPKGTPRRVEKAQRDQEEAAVIKATREYVWKRSRGRCEGCGDTELDTERRLLAEKSARPARHELHERIPRSSTRGLPPAQRFNPNICCRLCPLCHADVTENRKAIQVVSERLGCDGRFKLVRVRA